MPIAALPPPAELRAAYLAELDSATAQLQQRARQVLTWFVSGAGLLIFVCAGMAWINSADHKSYAYWLAGAGLASCLLATHLHLLLYRPPQLAMLARERLVSAELAQRIAAGLLVEHARLREAFKLNPQLLQQLDSGGRNAELRFLLAYCSCYTRSGPVTVYWRRRSAYLLFAGVGAVSLFVAAGYDQPLLLVLAYFYLAGAFPRLSLGAALTAQLAGPYLRAVWAQQAAEEATGTAEPVALDELERHCQYALDINRLEGDLEARLPGYAAPLRPYTPAGLVLLLGICLGLALYWHSPLAVAALGLVALSIGLVGLWLKADAPRYRERVQAWLARANLPVSIALEETSIERLAEQLPPPARTAFRRSALRAPALYRSGLKQMLWLTASQASALLPGAGWLASVGAYRSYVLLPCLVGAVLLGGGIGVWLTMSHSPFIGSNADALGFDLLAVCLLAGPAMAGLQLRLRRRAIAAREFLAQLRAALQA